MSRSKYFVSILDVSGIFPFCYEKTGDLRRDFENKQEALRKLSKFVYELQGYFGEGIHFVEEDRNKKQIFEQYIFDNSGVMEIILENPVAVVAKFDKRKRAQRFCISLKKTFANYLDPEKIEHRVFMDSIKVSSNTNDNLNIESWQKISKIKKLLRNTLIFFGTTLGIFALIEYIKSVASFFFSRYFHIGDIVVTISVSVIIAFLFRPMELAVNQAVSKLFQERKKKK